MSRHTKFLETLIKPFNSRQSREGKREENLVEIASKEQKLFPYEVLAAATNNFSSNTKLGEGGFGPVYKGKLEDGRVVAVKKLSAGSKQGVKQFMNEATLLSSVQHKNIVNLYGYYAATDDDSRHPEKLLVYEYISHESLDRFLFDEQQREDLDWKKRYDIIGGVARGILYLHEDSHTTIIHRDIKASNILLDDKWTPKIADFGMARLYPEDQTHVNTRIAGTNGYMAPEYLMRGQLSKKADVFSFGVLVLELVSGHKNSAFIFEHDALGVLECAWKLYKKRQLLEMMDPSLKQTAVDEQVAMCLHMGLLCTQADPKLRPDMRRVVVILSKKPSTLEEPTRPGFPGSRHRRSHGPSSGRGVHGEFSSSHTASVPSSSSASTSNTNTRTMSTPAISPRPPSQKKHHGQN